jgi:citrate synthase
MDEKARPTTATITLGDQVTTCDVVYDPFGDPTIIVPNALFDKNKTVLLSWGSYGTATTSSAITYINGEKGLLLYRGYPIEQIAESCSFAEVAHLLLKGELPTKPELLHFRNELVWDKNKNLRGLIDEQMIELAKTHRRVAHPMEVISTLVKSLNTFCINYDPDFLKDEQTKNEVVYDLIAKTATIVAATHRCGKGKPVIYPQSKFGYVENFLNMYFAQSESEPYEINDTVARALSRILILHADHEQNASTNSVRGAASTGVHPFAALSSGIIALWGPLHGGANEAVVKTLGDIHASGASVESYIEKAKSTDYRLPGFGHRVYKAMDPRADIMRRTCHELLDALKISSPLFDIALEMEARALKDSYFLERSLYPNVDFYSGISLLAMDVEPDMFTPIFALGRTPGWAANWLESVGGPQFLNRPRQNYTGYGIRDVVPINKRVSLAKPAP